MSMANIFTVKSAHDGLELSVMTVIPEEEPVALVQLAHGMAEHKERYMPVMQFLAANGVACIINDHRGHGGSVRDPRDLGYFYADGGRGLVKDMHQLTELFRAQHPGVPLILFGHSMGSLAARAYAAQFGREIDGLIVCGSPGFNPLVKVALALTEVLSVVHGGRRGRSRLMNNLLNGPFEKRFHAGPFAWLSANADNVSRYEADPLCGFPFTLNGYRALLNLMIAAYDETTSIRRSLPVHFISGADDPCAPDEKGFIAAVQNMKRRGCAEVTSKLYPGLRHEILNEGVQEVRDDLLKTILNMAKRA